MYIHVPVHVQCLYMYLEHRVMWVQVPPENNFPGICVVLTESVRVSDIHVYVYVMYELAIHSFRCQKTHNITLTIDIQDV